MNNLRPTGGVSRVILLGSPHERRTELFQAALARCGYPPAQIVSYADVLAGRAHLAGLVKSGALVRLDSPGRDWANEKALLCAGADAPDDGYARLPPDATARLEFERGRIRYPRQWYLGLCRMLEMVAAQLAECSGYRLLNCLPDIAAMFDKPHCQSLLQQHGAPLPESLGLVSSFAELRERMLARRVERVFVKLAHGSSASGVVALHLNATRQQAVTTVAMIRQNGATRLYNSRRVCVYDKREDVAALLDELCRQRVYAERWLPKASHEGRVFDLRVVVIAGQVRHIIARQSRNPFTNLHLLNERGDVAAIRARVGDEAWAAMRQTCAGIMAGGFPRSLYAGLDILFTPSLRRHYLLEVNAFGDLLPGVADGGQDTYTAELATLCSTPAR